MQSTKELHFPSTHWSSVLAAGETESEQGRMALGDLLSRYRPALRCYLMQKFLLNEDRADDLFQSFVLEIVLEKGLIRQARPMKGHQFRSFLLTTLHNFATSKSRQSAAKKRQPEGGLQSLDSLMDLEMCPAREPAPEIFDVAWARAVVAEGISRMRTECENSGRPDVWAMFEGRLMNPILEGSQVIPYEEMVKRFQLDSPAHAHNLLITAKRMFGRCLRSVIAEYAPDDQAVELELHGLQVILSHAT